APQTAPDALHVIPNLFEAGKSRVAARRVQRDAHDGNYTDNQDGDDDWGKREHQAMLARVHLHSGDWGALGGDFGDVCLCPKVRGVSPARKLAPRSCRAQYREPVSKSL